MAELNEKQRKFLEDSSKIINGYIEIKNDVENVFKQTLDRDIPQNSKLKLCLNLSSKNLVSLMIS
jgi:hypothetical protein